jgi:hypothetical protein
MQRLTAKFGTRVVDQPVLGKYVKEEGLNKKYETFHLSLAQVASTGFAVCSVSCSDFGV